MRTRIRSHAQHLTGRRRQVARRPPDEELVLHLQHMIGNRATTRLLRQPVDAPAKPKSALQKAGLKTDTRVSDKMPAQIQAAFEESKELAPFLKGKFPGSAITKDFEIHSNEHEFNELAKGHFRDREPLTKNQIDERYGKIGGFFDRTGRKIHVRSRSTLGHAVHEAMHKVSSSGFRGFWADFLNEGVTQYFTDRLLVEQGLTEVKDHDYWERLACAKKLVALTDWQTVAAAYFQNDQKLREAVQKKLNVDLHTLSRLGGEEICARLR